MQRTQTLTGVAPPRIANCRRLNADSGPATLACNQYPLASPFGTSTASVVRLD